MNTLRADELFLSYYQLEHDPFAPRVPNFKFFPAQRKTILGQLHHLARHSELMLVVTGPKGSGKTLLRQALIASVNKDTVKIINVAAIDCEKVSDVLALFAEELQATDEDIASIIEQINNLAGQGISLYFMVDDAERLSEDVLQLLLNLTSEQLANLHVFLFAKPSILEQLENSSLGKEVTFNLPLTPYTLEETKEYLASRLDGAGQTLALFTDEQLLEIYTKSSGWPGVINQIASDILLDGMTDEEQISSTSFDDLEEDAERILYASDTERQNEKSSSKWLLPKKHLAVAGVVAMALVAILLFSKSPPTEQEPSIVTSHYEDLPAIITSETTQPLPIPVANEQQQANDIITNNTTSSNVQNVEVATNNTTTPKPAPIPSETKPVVEKTKPTTQSQPITQGNAWYRVQTGTHFTIQVSVASNEQAAQDFLRRQTGSYRYFKRLRSDKIDYVITHGEFASRSVAQEAIKALPAPIQESRPWVRTFASIKQELAD